MFDNAELGYTITPEVRFYLGKGYGKGFYIAPFYRNLKYDITGVNFTYTNQIGGKDDIDMEVNLQQIHLDSNLEHSLIRKHLIS
jgi:hypothetical protein